MKFRNYCIVVMGLTKDVIGEITQIAETKPNVLDARGIVIATFSSVAEPSELTEFFKANGRSFLLFDLNKNYSGHHIVKPDINEGLFGFLKLMNDDELINKTNELIKEVNMSSSTNTQKTSNKKRSSKNEYTDDEIAKMSIKEKENLLNYLIDKGVENLSEKDKKLAQKLAIK